MDFSQWPLLPTLSQAEKDQFWHSGTLETICVNTQGALLFALLSSIITGPDTINTSEIASEAENSSQTLSRADLTRESLYLNTNKLHHNFQKLEKKMVSYFLCWGYKSILQVVLKHLFSNTMKLLAYLILLSPHHLHRTGDLRQVRFQLHTTALWHQFMQQLQVELVPIFPQIHRSLQDLHPFKTVWIF